MNETDAKVLAAAENYNHERGQPPALIVVHPEIAKQMTTTRFRFPQRPKLDASVFEAIEGPPSPPLDPIVVNVKVLDTSSMSPLEYYKSILSLDCLDEEQVMRILEMMPHLRM